jgi:hypothetical protein
MLGLEYMTGGYSHMPVLYVIPVCLAGWYSGKWPALMLAVGITVAHVLFVWSVTPADAVVAVIARSILRGTVISIMGLWFSRLSEHERALEREVRTLKGLLPICSFCKSIRNETGDWEHVEEFVARHSDAEFSHGFCPSCEDQHYGSALRQMRDARVRRLAAVAARTGTR